MNNSTPVNIGVCQRCRAVAQLTHVITGENMLPMAVCWRCMTEATQYGSLRITPMDEYQRAQNERGNG